MKPLKLIPALCACLSLLASAAAAEKGPIELNLSPRAIETPMLKYRLLPAEADIRPGNAAPILLRMPWEETSWMNEVFPKLHEWGKLPLNAPEWKTSNGVLPNSFYTEMKRAAFRRDAHWEYPIYETRTPHLILLPDVQGLRHFLGHGLTGKIRYHLSRGELEQGREAILVGLANSQHLAQTPFYVNQLVAQAILDSLIDCVDELVSQPNSPNLYWALSTLPDSLLELDRAANFEGVLFERTLPIVSELEKPRDSSEWRKMATQLAELLKQYGDLPAPKPTPANRPLLDRIATGVATTVRSPLADFGKVARAQLPELLDIPAGKVAAMTSDEAAIRWYVYRRQTHDQNFAAALVLPPRQALPLLKNAKTQMAEMQSVAKRGRDHLGPMYLTVWTFRSKVQMLRVIEAVRHYMATHAGALPETLDAITDVPIPLDPFTNLPFVWKREGQTATLAAPPLSPEWASLVSADSPPRKLEYRLQAK